MYWPIGASRIFAASSTSTKSRILRFEEDAQSRETTEGNGSLVDSESVVSEGQAANEITSGLSSPVTPITPGIKPVEHDHIPSLSTKLLEQDAARARAPESLPLLSLRTSRTGHLFAVITSTSLTVWQTKVQNHPSPFIVVPNNLDSQPQYLQSWCDLVSR